VDFTLLSIVTVVVGADISKVVCKLAVLTQNLQHLFSGGFSLLQSLFPQKKAVDFSEKFLAKKISLASHGDAKSRVIFNSIDLKNPIKKRWSSAKVFVFFY